MIDRAKTVFALLTAGLSGYVLGVYSVATSVPKLTLAGELPGWFVAAEGQYMVAAGGATLCALAWVYVDYQQRANHD